MFLWKKSLRDYFCRALNLVLEYTFFKILCLLEYYKILKNQLLYTPIVDGKSLLI